MSRKPAQSRKALGKGLSALLPGRPETQNQKTEPSEPPKQGLKQLPIDSIRPNPLQPRTVFQPQRLAELAQSIRTNGIIQPLIVRRVDDHHELVAGERRWRAARLAGLDAVPVVVQDLADDRLLEITLIENIQREDLNPIEVAQAFDRMGRELSLSHEEIGKRTGKDRSTITNMLRLLRLPDDVQLLLAERRLSMGHARALLGIPSLDLQSQLAHKAATAGYSVRQVERLVQKAAEEPKAHAEHETPIDPNVKAAVQELERALGTRVRIIPKSDQRGRVEIEYYSQEDLDRIYQLIVAHD